MGCVSHTGYLTHGNSKGEADTNDSKRVVVRNLEERNMGLKKKSPKQGQTSAKDLTIELSEGRGSYYHKLD